MMVVLTHAPGRTAVPDLLPFGPWGGNGVSVFFALSGYLLWKPFVSGKPDLRGYALSRAARILPAFWLACVVLVGLRGGDLLRFMTMNPNQGTPLGVMWTLQSEVMFYVALPLLALIGRPLGVPVVLGGLSLAAELTVAWTPLHGSSFESFLPLRFWAFVPGMILAARPPKALGYKWLAAGVALLCAGAAFIDNMPGTGGGQWTDIPSTLGAGLIVAWGINAAPRPAWLWASGAAISYGLYLWHVDLMELYGTVGLLLAFVVASASYLLLERPIMEWVKARNRARRRPAGSVQLPIDPSAVEVASPST